MGKPIAVALSLLALATTASAAQDQATTRLEGTWKVAMRFTVAEGLRDRVVGQRVLETWRFRPRCARGACHVELVRAGRKVLLRRSRSRYAGTAAFVGSVTCNGQTYATGTSYVENWIVRVVRSASGPRGRRAIRIAGVGVTAGRSNDSASCDPPVVSRESVALSGVPARG
jgi:hypothetical protein